MSSCLGCRRTDLTWMPSFSFERCFACRPCDQPSSMPRSFWRWGWAVELTRCFFLYCCCCRAHSSLRRVFLLPCSHSRLGGPCVLLALLAVAFPLSLLLVVRRAFGPQSTPASHAEQLQWCVSCASSACLCVS